MDKRMTKEELYSRKARIFKSDASEVRFLLGGIGTGNISVNARGKLLDFEIFNWPSKNTKFPLSFFAIRAENEQMEKPVAKILESRLHPPYTSSHGYLQAELVNLPRMEDSSMICEYPFARVDFKDSELPVNVFMEAYTPFIPLNTDDSSIPCAIIRYHVKNTSESETKVSLVGTLPNAAGFEGYDVIENLILADTVKNEYRRKGEVQGLYYSPEHLTEDHLRYGNMAILTKGENVTYKTQWFDGEWVDGIQDFWDDFTEDGKLEKETVSDSVGCEFAQFHNFSFLKRREKIGSIGSYDTLQPGEERVFEFVITWYFPNRVKAWIEFDEDYENFRQGKYGTVRNYYATKFKDAWQVGEYVYENLPRLEKGSRDFAEAMFRRTSLPYIAVNISFNTLLFVGFLRGIPGELEEAGIIDGCNLFQLCARVVIPVMKPTFVTILIFNAVYIYNEFPFASTFTQNDRFNTVSLMTSMFKGQYSMDYSGIIAASLMIMLPELVFYVFLQKYIIGGMTAGAVKG